MASSILLSLTRPCLASLSRSTSDSRMRSLLPVGRSKQAMRHRCQPRSASWLQNPIGSQHQTIDSTFASRGHASSMLSHRTRWQRKWHGLSSREESCSCNSGPLPLAAWLAFGTVGSPRVRLPRQDRERNEGSSGRNRRRLEPNEWDEYQDSNRITVDDLGAAPRLAGFHVTKLELLSHTVHLPPGTGDIILSHLGIAGVTLLAHT